MLIRQTTEQIRFTRMVAHLSQMGLQSVSLFTCSNISLASVNACRAARPQGKAMVVLADGKGLTVCSSDYGRETAP